MRQKQTYQLWTYDLWADGNGGYSVNDRHINGRIEINVKGKVYNKGTGQEFIAFDPTNRQLNCALNVHGLDWEGESDNTLYATDRHGDPACELERL